MSLGVIFTPEAVNDTLQAYNHYKKIDSGLAEKFNSRLDQKIHLIQAHPKSTPLIYKHFRRTLLHTFPFALFYTVEPDHIRIFGLIHQRQHFPDILENRE